MLRFNRKILEDSDFFNRFLNFINEYDDIFGKNASLIAKKWVDEDDLVAIYFFLLPSPFECDLHVSSRDIINLSINDFKDLQKKESTKLSLIDNKISLFNELLSS